VPRATRIGVLWDPTTPSHLTAIKAIEVASEKLGVELVMAPAGTITDIEGGFSTMTRGRVGGVLVLGSPLFNAQGTLLAELQVKHQLPEIFANRANVDSGGLMSYGADFNDLYRRAATYIDKILKGTKPADLPVEQASKYVLVVNLKAAKALGLTIPPTVLARADEVIE
jgi:putative ABC transport system substrate-binding protein